jgi:uncharacterized protein YajQ (UPF0234 family)
VKNAISQAMKEIVTPSTSGLELNIELREEAGAHLRQFKLKAVRDVLGPPGQAQRVAEALTWGEVDKALGGTVRQAISCRRGSPPTRREIVKLIKQQAQGRPRSRGTSCVSPARTDDLQG